MSKLNIHLSFLMLLMLKLIVDHGCDYITFNEQYRLAAPALLLINLLISWAIVRLLFEEFKKRFVIFLIIAMFFSNIFFFIGFFTAALLVKFDKIENSRLKKLFDR